MRLNDALIGNTAYGAGTKTAVLNIQHGGMNGFVPVVGEYVNNQQYIRRNLICLLVEAPKGFQYLPDATAWVNSLRSLVELHATRITGLNMTLEVETNETPVGGGGQFQEDPTDVKESRSQITFSWNEKYGIPIYRFHAGWIRNLIMDPNTKTAAINTLATTKVTDMLADMYTATMAFIETDPTHSQVVKSWLVTNMFPKSSGEQVGQKDVSGAGEQVNYDIPYAGIAQFGLGIDVFCQTLLDGINITGATAFNRPAWLTSLSSDVSAATTSYSQEVANLAATAIKV